MSEKEPDPLTSTSNSAEANPTGNSLTVDRKPPSALVLTGWILLSLLVIGVAGAAWFQQLRKQRVAPPPPVYNQVSAPTFIDETGTSFSITELDGRIWVADFIFTRCGSQCPVMSTHMRKLQNWLEENEMGNVQLVSVTVDPESDSPEALKRYAEAFKADPERWHFLTGDRKTIYDYILNDFHLETAENEGKPVADLFVHSDKFVLLDRNRHIRGYYSAMEDRDMEKLRETIISLSHHDQTSKKDQ